MKRKMIIILIILLILPQILVFYLGFRFMGQEQSRIEKQLQGLLEQQLDSEIRKINLYMNELEEQLAAKLNLPAKADDMRMMLWKEPLIKMAFKRDADKKLIFPPPQENLQTGREKEFLQRSFEIWQHKEPFYRKPENPARGEEVLPPRGWYSWFHADGLHFILWKAQPDGSVNGLELNRAALISRLIALLPHQQIDSEGLLPEGRVRLLNASSKVIYQWGDYQIPSKAEAAVLRFLSPPLGSWFFEYYVSPDFWQNRRPGKIQLLLLTLGMTAICLSLLALGIYFMRENNRALKEAGQRVSFVNQVSHELKTPLTNICLYAELLENQLNDDQQKARHFNQVIIRESQRLGRLINNVLSFSRSNRGKLKLYKGLINPNHSIKEVVDNFRPLLEEKEITLEIDLRANQDLWLDPDLLKQVLGNLLNNIEKYAASGKKAFLRAKIDHQFLLIEIEDWGPGIPKNAGEKVFSSFYRVNSSLTEGVSGTGLGLSLARELARLHGGDLKLIDKKDPGCLFKLSLSCEKPEEV